MTLTLTLLPNLHSAIFTLSIFPPEQKFPQFRVPHYTTLLQYTTAPPTQIR